MTGLPMIDLTGDATTRGRAHGEALRPLIEENIETYLARFAASGIARDDTLAEGARWAERIAKFDPDYAAEMHAIANAARLDIAPIGMLNARWELTYSLYAQEAAYTEIDGCTAFAALPEATRSGTTLLGQNWDWLKGLLGHMAVLRCRRDDAPDFICITQAGIAGGIMGLNEAGIGLVVNGLTTDREGADPERKPFHLRVREIMGAQSLATALRAILETPRVCSANFLLGHAEGEAIDVEAAPDDASTIYPEDGVLTHANHFEALPSVTSTIELARPSTLYRARRLKKLMRQANRPVDIDLMRDLFTDHFSHPNSICAHPDPADPETMQGTTVVSVILDLTNKVLYATNGPPCENAYQEYRLAG
jgi:isopenicillin-N N-acyltransferase-like protein